MKKLFLFLLLSINGFAMELSPWLAPVWEFQSRASYFYNHDREVDTANGTEPLFLDNHTLGLAMNATFWPYWNAEVALDLTHTPHIPFGYRALYLNVRYQWKDDVVGDPFSLTSGVCIFFPANRFLHELSFPYHGRVNVEIHTAIGKEFAADCEWLSRIWAYVGLGCAEKGSPWAHTVLGWQWHSSLCSSFGIYGEGVFGFGSNDLLLLDPFEGYGPIHHQSFDLSAIFERQLGVFGTLSVGFWINLYARNFIKNRWGVGASLLIPFSL